MELAGGQSVGQYRLKERIGRRHPTEVWRAHDERHQHDVTIKLYSPGLGAGTQVTEHFQREAEALARVEHPNLLPILSHGEHNGRPYIVGPYIEGGTLRAQLDGRAWLLARAIEVLEPLAGALDYLHQCGRIHGNLKPSNVLLADHGRPLLTDFLALRPAGTPTDAGLLGLTIGAPGYAAPEQASGGPATPATDRYSLGVLAYVLLTGRPPFVGSSALKILLDQIVREPLTPRTLNPQLPQAAEQALLAMLAKNPDRRCVSGAAFIKALRAAEVGQRGGFRRFLTSAAASNSLIPECISMLNAAPC